MFFNSILLTFKESSIAIKKIEMEFRTDYNHLLERIDNLETLVGSLIKWTQYDQYLQNGINSVNFNKSNDEKHEGRDQQLLPTFVRPNFDKSIPVDDIDGQVEAKVVEIDIEDLEIVKVQMKEEYQQDYQSSSFQNVNKAKDTELYKSLEEASNDDGELDSFDMDFMPSFYDDDDDNEDIGSTTGGIKDLPNGKSFRPLGIRRRSVTCAKCGKSFSHKGNLKQHDKSVHLGLREFSCPHCEKKFSLKANMVTHINAVHFGIRHQCPTCLQTFASKRAVQTHLDRDLCFNLLFNGNRVQADNANPIPDEDIYHLI